MTKYRITHNSGQYRIEFKFLFWWFPLFDNITHDSLNSALINLDSYIEQTKVIDGKWKPVE